MLLSRSYSFNSDDVQYNARPQLTDKMVRATLSCYDTTLLVYKFYKYKHVHSKGRHYSKHPLSGGRRKAARQVGHHHDIEFSVVRYKVRCLLISLWCFGYWLWYGVNLLEFLSFSLSTTHRYHWYYFLSCCDKNNFSF